MRVVLHPAGGNTGYVAETNTAGAFSFESVEPGNYHIELQHAGFGSVPGNQVGTLLHLDPGSKLRGLELTAVPLGSISGTILDDDGEPMVAALVELVRAQWQHGKRVWVQVHSARTNDLGGYRLDSLEAGEYYIRAFQLSIWPDVRIIADANGQTEMAAIPVFYHHASMIATASPLHVRAGQEVAGIDLRLALERTFHIRGTVDPKSIATRGWGMHNSPYMVASHDDGRTKDWGDFFGDIHTDGTFDIPGVPAGSYMVQQMVRAVPLSDEVRATVESRDVSGLRLALIEGSAAEAPEVVPAKGTIDIAGTFASPDPSVHGASAILIPERNRPGGYPSIRQADIDQRGAFIFWEVPPGRYRAFVVTGFDEGLWENHEFFRLVADQGVVVEAPESAAENVVMRITPKLLPVASVERAIADSELRIW